MDSLLIILMAIAMMATLVVLIIGMSGMVIGGEFNKKYGNKLMSARVILQGISIFLLALVILTQHHT
ncbi:MAG: twin transmembrane helix small protein [Rhodospirillales bacterium]|nr:twin transmembrane helix small protein [Rhodospirillales bacterium]MCB9973575.1 twin transmembrane helix small protein [Rhodospirillales bacterium]MCB9979621.1 twin transmembrane helix small protein [Rhodospirillales bacterium]